jgi:predicted RNA-binding Zn-ribbon protein involved in translation (DUF1610 family)
MDEGLTDPVMRCDSCQALIRRATIHKFGSCDKCGNRRIRNVTVFNEEEKKQIEEWGFGSFAAEFGAVDE